MPLAIAAAKSILAKWLKDIIVTAVSIFIGILTIGLSGGCSASFMMANGQFATGPIRIDPTTIDPGSGLPSVGGPVVIASGYVTDVERYFLALAAGFSATESITAVEISIAEDGSGNPSIMSGQNRNGTYDLGLMQINSAWWARFGGRDALTSPVTNFIAARYIYGVQGWCAWSTYERSCGIGHTGDYANYLSRAKAAAIAASTGN